MLVPITSPRKGLHVRLVDFYRDGTIMAFLADEEFAFRNEGGGWRRLL